MYFPTTRKARRCIDTACSTLSSLLIGVSINHCWWWNINDSSSLSSTAFPSSTITCPAISSPATSSSRTSSPATSSPTSSSSSTKFPVVKQLVQPDNDCEAIGPQYTIRIRTFRGDTVNTQFNVSCNTQFNAGDFMSFYSPSLTTCMHGCAMFNYWQTVYNNHLELNCSGVTYLPGAYGEGNCWLKPWGYTTVVTEQQNSSYARLNHVIWRLGGEGKASWNFIMKSGGNRHIIVKRQRNVHASGPGDQKRLLTQLSRWDVFVVFFAFNSPPYEVIISMISMISKMKRAMSIEAQVRF